MSARHLTALILMVGGALTAILGPIWIDVTAPTIAVPTCKGALATVSFCDATIHRLAGLPLLGLWAFILGGIAVFIIGFIVAVYDGD
jgi:hypothetical protein